MKDDAPVERPEGEMLTPTDHGTTCTGLSSVERYVFAKAVMGADLTECILRMCQRGRPEIAKLCSVLM